MSEVIPHWLDKQADLSPNINAVEFADETAITFQELRQSSQIFARKLSRVGVVEGNHVALYSSNSIEMIIALHALSYLGAVVVLINTRLIPSEIDYQMHDAKVSFLLTDDQLRSNANELSVVSESFLPVYSFSEVENLVEDRIDLKESIDLHATYTIIYTSGTTGFPKGVQHTYGNHWWSAISSALNLGLSPDDKWLTTLPLFHVGGLSILMKSVIYGMPVFLLEKFEEMVVNKAIINKGVTIVSVVSVMLERLIQALGDLYYPPSFRCMLLGGGPASEVLLEKASKRNIPVFQTYGMTETSSQIATLSPKDATKKLGSAGKALMPAQLKIVLNNKVAKPNEIGEIFVKGPMVTSGYFNKKDENQSLFHDFWLATGDMGYLDSEGFLYVVDRRKDLIISGGENIYPAEIENVVASIPEVKEVGTVGIEDLTWGQVPVVFIVKKSESSDLNEASVLSYCKKHLANYKVPKAVYFINTLPRNASNKLVRHKLLDLL